MKRINRQRIGVGVVLALALTVGLVWGLASGDDSSSSESAGRTGATDPRQGESARDDSGSTDPSGDDQEEQAGDDNEEQREGDDDTTADAGPDATVADGVGPFTLRSQAKCASKVAPQFYVSVSGGDFVDSGVRPQTSIDIDHPLVVLGATTVDAPAGNDHDVNVAAQEHLSGFVANRTDSTPGRKSIVVPATGSHVEWTFSYALDFGDGEVSVSDVELEVTGCEEMIVPQLRVTVEAPGSPTETLLDTGNATQRVLRPGTPLSVSGSVGLPDDIEPDAVIRVFFFDHATSRTVEVAHDSDGTFNEVIPVNGEGPAWILDYSIAGLG